jgi:hypothetical protein
MKKIILLLTGLLFILVLSAQNSSTYDATFKSKATYLIVDITGAPGDTIGSGDSTWTYTTRLFTPSKLFYDGYVALDSTGGTASIVTILWQGRDMSVDGWTTITTDTWVDGADTTLNYEQFTTAQPYKDYKLSITGADDEFAFKITRFIARFIYD